MKTGTSSRSKGLLMATVLSFAVIAPLGMAHSPAEAQVFSTRQEETVPGIEWDKKRLERLDRNLRRLERAVQKVENKNAPPILIEPDPEVVALQATVDILSRKLDDQENQITRLTGQLEEANHANVQLKRENENMAARLDTLTKRVDQNEAHLKDIEAQYGPPPPPPISTGSADGDFDQAYSLLTNGDVDAAGSAFEAFTTNWPNAAQTPEAWFRLGQIRSLKGDKTGSVGAYATSLKGWPKTTWAPEATVKLASALAETNQAKQSCAALTEFDKRYGTLASTPMKSEARALAARGKCT